MAFYTLGITAVFACLMPGSVNGDRVLRAFFPMLFRQYWYVTAYFGMCLFIPFFNLLLNRLSKGQLRLLALSIVLVFSVLPTLRQKDVFLTDNGYSVLWLSCLYLLGGVLRLCGRQTSRRPASRGRFMQAAYWRRGWCVWQGTGCGWPGRDTSATRCC